MALVMDDVKRCLLLYFFFLVAAIGEIGHSLDYEYIPPEKQKQLEIEFDQARRTFPIKDIADKNWQCDMYGMWSRLRVERGIRLYKFINLKSNQLTNAGGQILDLYTLDETGLIGQNDKVEDAVRLTAKGQLVARLSSLQPKKRVAAYSVCTAL
jgi:hypothetical protein